VNVRRPDIYFASALGRNREGSPLHEDMIRMLSKHGVVYRERVSGFFPVLSVTDIEQPTRLVTEAELVMWQRMTPAAKRADEIRILKGCPHLVAEVTLPSVQLGILLQNASDLGLGILCIRQKTFAIAFEEIPMLSGDPRFTCATYETIAQLPPIFERFFPQSALSVEDPAQN